MNRILIVEDEITISRLIAVSLRRAGYDCTVANGRGNNIQSSGHGVLLLSFTAPNVSNAPRGFASVFIIGIFAPGCKTAEKFKFFSSPH